MHDVITLSECHSMVCMRPELNAAPSFTLLLLTLISGETERGEMIAVAFSMSIGIGRVRTVSDHVECVMIM